MEIIYRASDGEVFKTQHDCEKYELLDCIRNKPYSMFADKNGNEISIDDFDSFGDCKTNTYYIVCRNYHDYLDGANAYSYFGGIFPKWDEQQDADNSSPHIWWWSNHRDRWVDMRERLDEIEKQKNIFEKLISAFKGD